MYTDLIHNVLILCGNQVEQYSLRRPCRMGHRKETSLAAVVPYVEQDTFFGSLTNIMKILPYSAQFEAWASSLKCTWMDTWVAINCKCVFGWNATARCVVSAYAKNLLISSRTILNSSSVRRSSFLWIFLRQAAGSTTLPRFGGMADQNMIPGIWDAKRRKTESQKIVLCSCSCSVVYCNYRSAMAALVVAGVVVVVLVVVSVV